ncbi:MAG: RnfABCDGE type electron transport complex subunit G [Alphaproteobacteria bacterium]|nr:RnfABCDGE type electron transport complex subunit G [Alphaproteobacteria bacterium]
MNMVLALGLVTVISAAAISGVHSMTKERIATAKVDKANKAVKEVISDIDMGTVKAVMLPVYGDENAEPLQCYPNRDDGGIKNVVIKTYSDKGYGGLIWLMAGFMADGTIVDVSVLEQKETPGLGTKISDDAFISQFRGKNPETFSLKVRQDGGDVDAVTAATISSRAFCDALERAHTSFTKWEGKK